MRKYVSPRWQTLFFWNHWIKSIKSSCEPGHGATWEERTTKHCLPHLNYITSWFRRNPGRLFLLLLFALCILNTSEGLLGTGKAGDRLNGSFKAWKIAPAPKEKNGGMGRVMVPHPQGTTWGKKVWLAGFLLIEIVHSRAVLFFSSKGEWQEWIIHSYMGESKWVHLLI